MPDISVVIITKNAERSIAKVLERACALTDDVVVLDSFSTDKTSALCQHDNVHFYQQAWKGFSAQKNDANQLALHDWILSLDADEVLSVELIQELSALKLNTQCVYDIPFINIYCDKEIKFGRWRNERHVRLFNKKELSWKIDDVHETLQIKNKQIVSLQHCIYHYSMNSKEMHLDKAKQYAQLGAEKMHKQGKNASYVKRFINPPFRFIKDYLFSLGFLDGKEGFQIAWIQAKETYWKYKKLKELKS